jgi:hypothetical protein
MLFNPKLTKADSLVKLSSSYISFIIARNRDLMKKYPTTGSLFVIKYT